MRVSCRPQRSKENVGPAGLPDMMMNVNAVSLFINIQISFLFLSLSHSFKYLYGWKNGRQLDVTYIHLIIFFESAAPLRVALHISFFKNENCN
jgi:hypothetical protein